MTFAPAFSQPFPRPFGGVTSAAFSPLNVAGLRLWVDFSDRTTLFQDAARTIPVVADGDVIGGVADKSGNGFHGAQTLTADKPLYKVNIKNGRSVARFDGAGDRLVSALVQTTLIFTMFSVCRSSSVGGVRVIVYNGSSDGYAQLARINKRQMVFGNVVFLDDGNQTTNYELWTTRRDTITTLAINGTNQSLTNNSAVPKIPINNTYIGGLDATNGFLGDICEVLIYDNAVSAPNISIVETYLNAKWAVY